MGNEAEMYTLEAVVALLERERFPEDIKSILIEVARKLVYRMNEYINELSVEDSSLRNAISHLLGRGKFLRGIFSYIVGRALGAEEDPILTLAVSSEFYHTASLIHDDIIDKACIRRGVKTVHEKYGLERAIIAGDALIIYPNYILSKFGGEVIKTFAKAGLKLCDGEALELIYTNNLDKVNLETYNKIVYKKTASFFEHLMEAVAIISDKREYTNTLSSLGRYLGMAFQYRDDMLDVIGDPRLMGKPVGTDENKPNLIHVLMIEYKISIEEALEKAYKLISRYVEKAIAILNDLPISSFDRRLLVTLARSLSNRVV